MCRHHSKISVCINGKLIDIDSCLLLIIKALNKVGLTTIASCCGHGKQPGNIALEDGREIFIISNYNDARKINELFPPINNRESNHER